MLLGPVDAPRAAKQQQRVALHILDGAGVAGQFQMRDDQLIGIVQDPEQMLIRQGLHTDIDIVLVFQTVLQNLQLQHTDHADNDLLHASAEVAEDLDRAFLRDLLHALDELLALHRVHLRHTGKMLGCKGRDAGKLNMLFAGAERVADREDARVKQTDNIARIRLIDDRAVLCHQLLRLGVVDTAFALEPSDIKSFRILEDGEVLYEGEKGNFRSCKSDIKERLNELKPRIDEYRMLRHQYEMMEEMRRSMEDSRRDDNFRRDDPDYRDRMPEPDFNIPNPVEKFAVEITLDHPYWKSFYKETGAPKFDSNQPSTIDYLDDYTQKTEGLHALAQNLMQIIDPQAQEQVIDPHASTRSTQSAPQAAPVQAEDPTVALPKYKALLDAGVITAEEFEAKKKQLLGL